jgi:hypothetical protein
VRSSSPYELVAEQQDSFTRHDLRVTYWRLKLAEEWTIAATELTPLDAESTTIVIADRGRSQCSSTINRLLAQKQRVVAVDPFGFGESQVSQNAHLFAFMVATVGQRPLGIQAEQVAAVARWLRGRFSNMPVALVAEGPRTSLVALVAAGLEVEAIRRIDLFESLGSLKEIIDRNQLANQTPELFCFGLLQRFDVLQLAALVAPRMVGFHRTGDRAKTALEPLRQWYETFEMQWNPDVAGSSPPRVNEPPGCCSPGSQPFNAKE